MSKVSSKSSSSSRIEVRPFAAVVKSNEVSKPREYTRPFDDDNHHGSDSNGNKKKEDKKERIVEDSEASPTDASSSKKELANPSSSVRAVLCVYVANIP